MTREEAIEVYNGLINEKIKAAFEFFVPELRESEDERARKELILYFNSEDIAHQYVTDDRRERWVSYLEKQKEQKPAEWSKEDENKIERLAFLVSLAEEKEIVSHYEGIDLRNFIKSLRPQPHEEKN